MTDNKNNETVYIEKKNYVINLIIAIVTIIGIAFSLYVSSVGQRERFVRLETHLEIIRQDVQGLPGRVGDLEQYKALLRRDLNDLRDEVRDIRGAIRDCL